MSFLFCRNIRVYNLNKGILCPLCGKEDIFLYHRDKTREYNYCSCCSLVFVPPRYHLSDSREKAEYDLHENNLYDKGYRCFLGRLFGPVSELIAPESEGLDFGCGSGPALALMFEEAGHKMSLYDKFYYPDKSVLKETYHFITATEVLEHISEPSEILPVLWSILKPGGCLGLMTKLVKSPEAFKTWHYKNDTTHICYYSKETFLRIAGILGAGIKFYGSDVILLEKSQGNSHFFQKSFKRNICN